MPARVGKPTRPANERLLPFPALQPDRAGGVLTEQRALPDVAAKHRRALVARLLGDDALRDAAEAAEVARPARSE